MRDKDTEKEVRPMGRENATDKFREYLKRIQDTRDDKCWFCNKTPDKIREDFFEFMKNPPKGFEKVELEDLLIMTYKTRKPVCAGCYFAIKQSPKLVQEILEKPENEAW